MGIATKLTLVTMVSIIIGASVMAMISVWLPDIRFAAGYETEIMVVIFIATFALSVISIGKQVIAKHRMAPAASRIAPDHPLPRIAKKRLENRLQEGPSLPGAGPSEELDEDNQAKEGEAPSFGSPDVEEQYRFAMKFLGDGMAIVKANHDLQSNFNKFGINMFLAGGCDLLCQRNGLDEKIKFLILGEAVNSLGFEKKGAYGFAKKCHDYLLADSRYMQMFQSGRNAMSTYFTDQALIGKHMDDALIEWNEPKRKDDKAGPVTVMFTDMVGSTAFTQTSGDAAAHEVVHIHNRIVRDALKMFNGKEIKHTGDGIMASFANTSSAVEGAIYIQRKTAAHNDDNSRLPLHLKIGINVGEPIVEDDDLFGITVQLSARIVDKAQSEQIFVSETVRGICAGKGIRFFNRGKFAIKGFEDDIILYEVIWDDSVSIDELEKKAAQELKNELEKTTKKETKEKDKKEEEKKKEKPAAEEQAAPTVEEQVEPQPDGAAIQESPHVAEQGEATVQYTQGLSYSLGLDVPQNDREAAKWYRLAAEQGHAGAQFILGELYDKGRGIFRDHGEAAKLFRLAAEQGHAGAQSNLAEMYDKGRGVSQDNKEAAKWYGLAAEQGDAVAQFSLGVMYENGQGVPLDHNEAVKWYRRAAEQGDVDAQSNMGVMHVYGRGVLQDYVRAHMWWNIAAEQGDQEAAKYRDQLEDRMSSADISNAKKLAREWTGKHEANTSDP